MIKHERVGKLQVLKAAGTDDDLAIIMLHGFGADASDLFPLHKVLDPEGKWNWYFPEAPLEVPIAPGFMGRAWFPISLRAMDEGLDFSKLRPPGMNETAQILRGLIKQVPEKRIVVGGFSQGAMLATEVALTDPQGIMGLLILSGTLIDEDLWRGHAAKATQLKFFSSHGQRDAVLPYAGGQKLYEMLKHAGLHGSHVAFSGGHEIPMQALVRAKEFLQSFQP